MKVKLLTQNMYLVNQKTDEKLLITHREYDLYELKNFSTLGELIIQSKDIKYTIPKDTKLTKKLLDDLKKIERTQNASTK